jgi:hypothetical protein
MCSPAVDPAWQFEINPDGVRLRELLSIQLPIQTCCRKKARQRPAHVCREASPWAIAPRGDKVDDMLIIRQFVEFSGKSMSAGQPKK